jgi:hypothetical protein
MRVYRDRYLRLDSFLFPLICPLQRLDIKLFHFEERLGYACSSVLIRAGKHLVHNRRSDLLREAVPVLEPAALSAFRIGGEPFPKIVDFVLRLAGYDE